MLNELTSPPSPTVQGREVRRQHLLQALHAQAQPFLERLADELVELPDDKVFGALEETLRDLSHAFVTPAHQAGIDAGKKRAPSAPVGSARTARPTLASSPTAQRRG